MRAIFALVLSFIVSGCAGFAYDKFTVKDWNIEQSSRLAEVRIVGVNEKSVTVEVKNISNSPITIDWNEAQIGGKPVYVGALVSQVESGHRDVAPSFLPQNKKVTKSLFPAENVSETGYQSAFVGDYSATGYSEISKYIHLLDYPTYITIKISQNDFNEYVILNVDAEYITITDCGKGKDENGKYMEDRRYELENIIYENGGYLPDGSRVKNVRNITYDKDCK